MRLWELFSDEPYRKSNKITEMGRIVKGVNTTVDVQPGEIARQAAKFGNTVDENGCPPLIVRGPAHFTNAADMPNKGDMQYGKDGTKTH